MLAATGPPSCVTVAVSGATAQARCEAERAACDAVRRRVLQDAMCAWKCIYQKVRQKLSAFQPVLASASLDYQNKHIQLVVPQQLRRILEQYPITALLTLRPPKQGQQAEAAACEALARCRSSQAAAALAGWRAAAHERRDARAAGQRMADGRAARLLCGVFVEWRALLQVGRNGAWLSACCSCSLSKKRDAEECCHRRPS